MGVGSGVCVYDIVVKSSRSLFHLLMSSCCHYNVVGQQVHALQSTNLKNHNNLIQVYRIS